MNFGEKFPYALLTFSPSPKSFSQKFVEADCGPHLLPKVCRSWLLGTLHPNHYPHAQLHINSHTPYTHTPHPIHPHPPYTSYTPTHTPPPAS